ncbi:HupE/UreJ family protein [Agrobacterium vitis]|uniref:HupE/UreJ family protein n=1 Tax=Agrobacterium vitis TaxID=373 RepID=UPI001F3C06AB|nr:HupE/UreJ family protein [Agrobacterium vitis]
MPANANGLVYAGGFLLTTSLLISLALIVGSVAQQHRFSEGRVVRPLGAMTAVIGLWLLHGVTSF